MNNVVCNFLLRIIRKFLLQNRNVNNNIFAQVNLRRSDSGGIINRDYKVACDYSLTRHSHYIVFWSTEH